MERVKKIIALKNSPGAVRYLKNTSLLLGEKVFRMVTGLFVSIWVARYLGPEQFGLLSYAQSFVALFAVVTTLGLDGIIVRELVKNDSQKQREELLGTAFLLRLITSIVVLVVLTVVVFLQSNDYETNLLVVVIGSTVLFQSFNVIDFYFQSKVLSKYVVYSNLISLILSSLIKISLILNNASLIAFAYVILFDSLILMLGLIFYYLQNKLKISSWTFNLKLAKILIKDSWPLIISSIVVTIYMKIDIIMLKELLGEQQVGLYSASSRISELWYFIPVIVTSSFFPAILNAKNTSTELYNNRVKNLYRLLIWAAIILSIFVNIVAHDLIAFLYGTGYEGSSQILIVQIWSSIFIALMMVSNKWLLAENKTKFIFVRGTVGAVINVILNYIYIPIYGVQAAAYTSLITLIFSSLVIDLFTPTTRKHLLIKLAAFVPLYRKI
ncbi:MULTISPECIES: flippase [unclassified Pseudoalteromonas]|uniref:flippase n=1 Tax=unclassified Pseudoalteromonas TaxID=194690 RepID=UPI001109FF8B|nr:MULTISPECIES: flippase [unclassified Pseudoalteromonas]TMN78113.1 flippase [Pseudoalteromonas sp. S410]TMN90457.1 flippase [Pseudoalteromonas sp. S408]TMN96463.1 flippase [Pseudoalteromonas sp. S407]TMO00610.1 flippase [Pseudoalteromonas sp. S409]TMO07578.1 flippase [Pseudoalteromonas sp. S186]